MSKYQELLQNPPTFTKLYDSENLREVIFELISCMCDNKYPKVILNYIHADLHLAIFQS